MIDVWWVMVSSRVRNRPITRMRRPGHGDGMWLWLGVGKTWWSSGPMRAPERGAGQEIKGMSGEFGAGARRETRIGRPRAGQCNSHVLPFQISAPRWGGVSR
jgi:hypothetical protein